MCQTVQRGVRRRENEYVVRHDPGLISRDDLLPADVLLTRSSPVSPWLTIMLSRTLLSTLHVLRRPGQLATRTRLTPAWRAEPSSGFLQTFSPSRSRNATHRDGTSGGRAFFNAPKPPRFGFWQQISQKINRIPSNFIFWGIFGINGVVFVLWQVANTQWVNRGSPRILRQKKTDTLSILISDRRRTPLYRCSCLRISHRAPGT